MNMGIIGLGRMGLGIAERLIAGNHTVIGFDVDVQARQLAADSGVIVANSMPAILEKANILWLSLPAGGIIDSVIDTVYPHLKVGTIIIDGGNSLYTDSIRRATMLAQTGINFVDCGVSGGIHGRSQGYCLMVGGDSVVYETIKPLLEAIAQPKGLAYIGPSGAGHYVKMIHNGIEYGILQAYGEGLDTIRNGSFKQEALDLATITALWDHGSIIRSWILTLTNRIMEKDQDLISISGTIDENGTGRWAAEEARKHAIATPVLDASLQARVASRETGGNYGTKVVALLRQEFGGHPIKRKNTREG